MVDTKEMLPGEDLIGQGLKDLSNGVTSQEALLALIGAPRLRRLGILIPAPHNPIPTPEHTLYFQLQRESPQNTHSRYNSLIRRLVSYERALELSRRKGY